MRLAYRRAGLSGRLTASTCKGVLAPRRQLQLERCVPTVTTVIDTAERIFAAFDIIDELTKERGLVTSETVPAVRAALGHHQRAGH